MATHYTISGHGSEDVSGSEFTLPEGVTVHFYVESGDILPESTAAYMWTILEKNPEAVLNDEVGSEM